jgi:hypothetical protein
MEDRRFVLYSNAGASLTGEIAGGCLRLYSEVYGEYDSEVHYALSKDATDKLFSLMSFEEFVDLCQEHGVWGFQRFLGENSIEFRVIPAF